MITDPITVGPNDSLETLIKLTRKHKITGVPVVDSSKKLVGILTSRDMRFETNFRQKVQDVMTPIERLITAEEGINTEEAKHLLHKHRIEKLPVISKQGELIGLITIKDILKGIDFPDSNRDKLGRLRVAAAIGVGGNEEKRADLLVEAGVDAIAVSYTHLRAHET